MFGGVGEKRRYRAGVSGASAGEDMKLPKKKASDFTGLGFLSAFYTKPKRSFTLSHDFLRNIPPHEVARAKGFSSRLCQQINQ